MAKVRDEEGQSSSIASKSEGKNRLTAKIPSKSPTPKAIRHKLTESSFDKEVEIACRFKFFGEEVYPNLSCNYWHPPVVSQLQV